MLNHFTAIGRFVADPELQHTKDNQPFCPFRLAVDRDFKNRETGEYDADYISCCIWGRGAEVIANRFKKGRRICVEGRIQTRKYEKEGKTRSVNEVIVSTFYFVDQKSDSSSLNKSQRLEPDSEPQETPDDYDEICMDIDPQIDSDY